MSEKCYFGGIQNDTLPKVLISDARNKPVIAAMIEQVKSREIDHDEIDALVVPLPWYKVALKTMLDRLIDEERKIAAGLLADQMGEIEIVEQVGKLYKYIGSDTEIETKQSSFDVKVKFPIKNNDFLWEFDGDIWLGATALRQFPTNVIHMGDNVTRKRYRELFELNAPTGY